MEQIPTLFESVVNRTPRGVPAPPYELIEFRKYLRSDEFRNCSQAEQEGKQKKFFSRESIVEYLNKKWEIELFNRDCFSWLYRYKSQEKDINKLGIIDNKLVEFKKMIEGTDQPYKSLILDQKKYNIKPEWE